MTDIFSYYIQQYQFEFAQRDRMDKENSNFMSAIAGLSAALSFVGSKISAPYTESERLSAALITIIAFISIYLLWKLWNFIKGHGYEHVAVPIDMFNYAESVKISHPEIFTEHMIKSISEQYAYCASKNRQINIYRSETSLSIKRTLFTIATLTLISLISVLFQ